MVDCAKCGKKARKNMELNSKILLISILIISMLPNVFADYSIEPLCDAVCIEGDGANFKITLTTENLTTSDMIIDEIEYTEISLKDKKYDALIARESTSIVLGNYDTKTISIFGVIPPPTDSSNLYYVPCFKYKYKYTYYSGSFGEFSGTDEESICGIDTLVMKVIPLSEIDCRYSSDCNSDERCDTLKCIKLNCKYNEKLGYRTCIPFRCEQNQKYENNECVDLQCEGDEYAYNHTCNELNCIKIIQVANEHKCGRNLNLIYALSGILLIFLVMAIISHNKHRKTKKKKK